MPRVGGIYSLPPGYKATTGDIIEPSQHNPPLEDIAQALTNSLARDGSAPMTGNLAMGNRRITGLATGTANSDAVRRDQVLLATGYLDSVSDLALAANEIPYSTGGGNAAKTALTSFARDLLAAGGAQAARDVLNTVPAGRFISAGPGLTGGGNFEDNRSFTLGTPSSITRTSTNSVSAGSHTHNLGQSDFRDMLANYVFPGTLGSFLMASIDSGAPILLGDVVPGSRIRPAGERGANSSRESYTMQGSWICMGYASDNATITLYQRIN